MCSRMNARTLGTMMAAMAVLALMAVGCGPEGQGPSPRRSSPAPDTLSSQGARGAADRGMYQPVSYHNASRPGPKVVVLDGDIKSNNATFLQKYSGNNIADYGELELGKANFKILERSDLAGLKREFQIAYGAGDPNEARKLLAKGKFKATRWVIRFDVLKAEPVAQEQRGIDVGRIVGSIPGFPGSHASGTYRENQEASVWIIGMRYTVIDASTTEQEASGYFEQQMEVGSRQQDFGVYNQKKAGGLTLDSLVQRLVQDCVAEIDAKYK